MIRYVKTFEQFNKITSLDMLDIIMVNIVNKYFNHEKLLFSEVNDILFQFLKERGYAYIGEGRNRFGFVSKDYKTVIKISKSWYGDNDNYFENDTYKRNKDSSNNIYAKCKLFTLKKSGIRFLIMEYIKPVNLHTIDSIPDWINSIDCGQVGFDNNGNLKAYDYGSIYKGGI